jgi:SpoIID/LytB domain protein
VHTSNSRARARLARAALVLGVVPASAAIVLTPANAAIPAIANVTITGHGWGPGLGMGQWGDFGYAVRYHYGYEAILDHFYGGTHSTSLSALGQATDPTISVLINENMNATTNVGWDPVVTSASAFVLESTSSTGATTTTPTTAPTTTTTTAPTTTVPSATTSVPVDTTPTTLPTSSTAPTATATGLSIPAGVAVDVHLQSNGTWSAYEASSCTAARAATATTTPVATGLLDPIFVPASTAPGAPSTELLTLCRHDGVDEPLRGEVEAYDRQGYERTLNFVDLDSYLDGVVPAEESASWGDDGGTTGAPQGEAWGFQALEAQAVAARTYTMAYVAAGGWNGYASICDSTDCESYVGSRFEYPISDLAVADTTGEVRVNATDQVVSTRFSASTGGYTTQGTFPAVPDLGDACVVSGVALECNPNHNWRVTVTGRAIARHFPALGTLLAMRVTKRNGNGTWGGRSVRVVLIGTKSRRAVSGDAFATALGLKSDWFAFAGVKRAGVAAPTTTTSSTTTTTTTLPTTTVTSTTLPATTTSTSTAVTTTTG